MLKRDALVMVFISIVLLSSLYYLNTSYYYYETPEFTVEDTLVVREVKLEYGFPVDSFQISHHKIKRNEFLADILGRFGVSYSTIDYIARHTKNIFDVRKIRRGNNYALFTSIDSTQTPIYFIYEETPRDYIVYHLRDSVYAERRQKEIKVERKHVKGVIESSLWNAMKDASANPMLAVELSEIYAWTIDFFGIQKGDAFEVIYDEEFVDSLSIGISNIYVSSFFHYNEEFMAYQFMQDSVYSYFDQNGKSLRKAFLKAPLRFSRISSGFSHSRLHPILKIRRPHHGIDYAAPTGTPVYSIGDGVITKKGYQKRGGGNYLKIKHNSVYTTVYMHFSGFAKGMYVGKAVKQGDVIGYVGSSGLATGPHLDFRVYKNGQAIDPLKVESPPVDPVKEENLHQFSAVVKHWDNMLANFSAF